MVPVRHTNLKFGGVRDVSADTLTVTLSDKRRELRNYITFLGCETQVEDNQFKRAFGARTGAETATDRVRHLMSKITLRRYNAWMESLESYWRGTRLTQTRVYSDTFCGESLVALPELVDVTLRIKYSREEFIIQRYVRHTLVRDEVLIVVGNSTRCSARTSSKPSTDTESQDLKSH